MPRGEVPQLEFDADGIVPTSIGAAGADSEPGRQAVAPPALQQMMPHNGGKRLRHVES